MTLTIYGSPRSRTMRVLWAAAELGLDYEHVPLAFDDPALKQPEFLDLNPAGSVPAIIDDGFALAESLAIIFYLTKKYGTGGPEPLYPASPQAEAEIWRWALWAQGHLEPWVQQDTLLADLRQAMGATRDKPIRAALGLLDRILSGREWLVGGHFTAADLAVAAVLSPSRARLLDLAPFARAENWLRRCYARPAAIATRQRFAG